MVNVYTGHGPFLAHLKKMRLTDSAACQYCGEEEDTAIHYLSECPAFGASRMAVFGHPTLDEMELAQIPAELVLKYIRRTRRAGLITPLV